MAALLYRAGLTDSLGRWSVIMFCGELLLAVALLVIALGIVWSGFGGTVSPVAVVLSLAVLIVGLVTTGVGFYLMGHDREGRAVTPPSPELAKRKRSG
jgi:hypothetical protein